MELSIGALRNWWNTSSGKQRMLAVLFLIGILATGMLLIINDTPETRNAEPQTLLTAETAESEPLFAEKAADPMNSSVYYVGVVIKMVAVLLLIVGGAIILRRWQTRRGGLTGRRMRLVESVRLSPKQALHLVRVGDRCVLIGATDQQISMLSEISLEEGEKTLASATAQTSFGDLLQVATETNGGRA